MKSRLLVLLLILGGPRAAAATSGEMLILAGGNSREEGQKGFDEVTKTLSPWSAQVTPAPGFPKLIESATVIGLKPGYFVTVWSICPGNSAEAVALRDLAALVIGGTYVRAVQWPEAMLPCPRVAGVQSRRIKTGKRQIIAALVGGTTHLALVDKNAQLIDTLDVELSANELHYLACDEPVLGGEPDEISVSVNCTMASCTSPERGTVHAEIKARGDELRRHDRTDITEKCEND